jgi:hypothetical protein
MGREKDWPSDLAEMVAQNLPLPQESRLDEISCGLDCIVFHIGMLVG